MVQSCFRCFPDLFIVEKTTIFDDENIDLIGRVPTLEKKKPYTIAYGSENNKYKIFKNKNLVE
jgi:hypothetical protein